MAYIDTSVLAAYYCPEALSSMVQDEIGKVDDPLISRLVEVELHSAVAQKLRARELEQAAANQILSLFQVHLARGYYRLASIEEREYSLARDWIGRFNTPLRTLDALHLAAAFVNETRILTSDQGLARSASLLGIAFQLIS